MQTAGYNGARTVSIFEGVLIELWKCDQVGWDFHTLISLMNVEPTLTDFEKFHSPQNKNPPSTPRLLDLCTSFFQKIPPSTFVPNSIFSYLATFPPAQRLFQPPRLLERWEYADAPFWSLCALAYISTLKYLINKHKDYWSI